MIVIIIFSFAVILACCKLSGQLSREEEKRDG